MYVYRIRLLLLLLLLLLFIVIVIVAAASLLTFLYSKSFGIVTKYFVYRYVTKFFDILLPDAVQCANDKLSVGDNTASSNTCGTSRDPGPTKEYSDGDVSVHFTTDGSGSGRGFMLTYKLVDKPVASKYHCGNVVLKAREPRRGFRVFFWELAIYRSQGGPFGLYCIYSG